MKTATIIGSGIAGIATSIRLQVAGYQVKVIEANSYPGGKLHAFKLGEYRFDGGPSLFTMPHFVDELFSIAGKKKEDYFSYQKSDIACNYFWEDGTTLHGYADQNRFADEVHRKLRVDPNVMHEYFAHIKEIYDHSGSIFLEKSLHKSSTWLSKETATALLKVRKYDLNRSMHRANKIRLGEEHLVQLFDRFATYNGSNPYKAPGILNVIPWLEHGFGTFFPKGGMEQIALSLYRLACDLGVEFLFNKKVDKIHVTNGKASAIETKEGVYPSDLVISNMDVFYTFRKLLADQKAPERILKQERSSSALVFYWGIKKRFKQLHLHNIFFSKNYAKEFECLFDQKVVSDDPTVYIHVSSKFNQEDAPEGCENWFVMINAPSNDHQEWEDIASKTKKVVINKLNRILDESIEPLIEEEKVWSPPQIESDTLSYKGALYGNSSNNQMAAFLRHPNFSSKIKDLYFCGGSVHPGGGIPLALLSAKITSEIITR